MGIAPNTVLGTEPNTDFWAADHTVQTRAVGQIWEKKKRAEARRVILP